jgi:thiamine kinase-like enzyme
MVSSQAKDTLFMTLDLTPIHGFPKDILPEKIKSIQIIKGGLNNRNVLINGSYLLKEYLPRDEKNDPVRLRYFREKTALTSLTKFNFIPSFLISSEEEGKFFIARSWLEGRIMNPTILEQNVDNLVTTLSSLHKQRYSSETDYDYFDVIERYLREYQQRIKDQKIDFPDTESILSFYNLKREVLRASEVTSHLTRIHGDLVFSNIIYSAQKCILIDWEYTTSGDPLIDLAYLITQNTIPLELEKRLINTYMQQYSLEIDPQRLAVYKNLMNLMSALWYALQSIRLFTSMRTHTELSISSSKYAELAKQSFSQLKIK